MFCSGADLSERGAAAPNRMPAILTSIVESAGAGHRRASTGTRGPGGLGLIAAADMAVAAEASTFAFTEVRVGVAPAMILVPALRVVDRRFLARATLTGERFSASEAAAAGLLTAVVPDEPALDAWVADQTTGHPPGGARRGAGHQGVAAVPARAGRGPRGWPPPPPRRPSCSPEPRPRRGWRPSWRSAAPSWDTHRHEHAPPVAPGRRQRRVPRQRRRHGRAGRRGARPARRRARRWRRAVRGAPPRPRQDAGARAPRGAGRPRHPGARAVPAGRAAHRRPGRRRRRGGAGRGGAHPVPRHRQRPDRARRDDEPDDDPQAAARHGRGRGEPPPAAPPGRVRRGRPAPPGRRLRPRGRAVPPPDPALGAGHPHHLRRVRLLDRRRRLPPGHERLHGHGRGPGPRLPGRAAAGEDGHRGGRRRGGAGRGAHARRDLGPVRLPGPRRARRDPHGARHRGPPALAAARPRARRSGRRAALPGRGAARHRVGGRAGALRRARDPRPRRRRLPLRGVQAALRRRSWCAGGPSLGGYPVGVAGQQRHPVLARGAEGRAVHCAVQPHRHADPVRAEHHRVHGRARATSRAGSSRTGPS